MFLHRKVAHTFTTNAVLLMKQRITLIEYFLYKHLFDYEPTL